MAAVDGLLGEPEPVDHRVAYGGRAARSQRHLLLPVLHTIQDRTGWVSRGALEYACRRLSIPPAEAYGVVSFYARFALEPRDAKVVHVCDDIVCSLVGVKPVEGAIRVPCLGLCDHAPAALVERFGAKYEAMQIAPFGPAADSLFTPLSPTLSPEGRGGLLRRVGVVDPDDIESYQAHGGFAALKRAREIGPAGVIGRLKDANLLGRGGAAFPTGRKWESVAAAAGRPHYLVCNADESEPGTFKDRVLMENDPFAVVEAMAIAAFAAGCESGFIYVRDEYPLARRRIGNAISQARGAGLLDVDIEVRRGAGAYICGEETALFNSIEGKRGEPRNKPPFPVEVGLFGKPTLVNNVETLVNVLDIVNGEFADTRIFCVSGNVSRPGVYEVPMGTPLRSLLEMAGAGGVQAVLLGGAAGSFLTPQQLDVPLSFEGTRAIGATLGSGAVIVFDEAADMKQVLLRIARFFRDESCGQCVPCRVGTKRQEEILERMLTEGNGDRSADVRLLSDIAQAMRDASICGLGQTAANAVASGLTQLKVLNG
ncbi:MAG: NADH-quinone oxidoreductase subunit E [Chloroflexi bacterium]|nr:MAG: NADH-quinone oxidoreductase subunit E [Chloroflexota bacterium]